MDCIYIFALYIFSLVPPPRPNIHEPDFAPVLYVTSVLLISFFYLNYYYLFPAFYLKGKKFSYINLVLISFLISFIFAWLFIYLYNLPTPNAPLIPIPLLLSFFLRFCIVLLLSSGIKVYNSWKKAENEKIEAEISYLKSQINPHFLFNTLNSIYTLSVIKSDHTSEAIVKLSNMMRYVISENNQDFVPLYKELENTKGYLNLQRLRLTSKTKVETSIVSEYLEFFIAPMLLMSFIENAFKYGVNTEEDCTIKIKIELLINELQFSIENKKVKKQIKQQEGTGLGLKNTIQRLNLHYLAMNVLKIEDQNE